MAQPSLVEQLTAGQPDLSLKDLQRNALSKQYTVKLHLNIVETDGGREFFDGSLEWPGVPYPAAVAIEQELVSLQQKFVDLGKAIATGTAPTA